MKKIVAIVLTVVFIAGGLTGCGISEEVYNAVVAERDAALAQTKNLQSDLSAAQAQVTKLESDLSAAQAAVTDLESDLSTAQAQVTELTSSLGDTQSELEAAQAKNSELTSGLAESQSELSAAESELSAAESELSAAESELRAFKTESKRLWTSLDGYLELNHYVLGINAELLRDDLDEVHEGCSLMTAKLVTLGDAELQALWEPAYVAEAKEWNLYFEPFYVFMEKHASRISSEAKAIRDKLAE